VVGMGPGMEFFTPRLPMLCTSHKDRTASLANIPSYVVKAPILVIFGNFGQSNSIHMNLSKGKYWCDIACLQDVPQIEKTKGIFICYWGTMNMINFASLPGMHGGDTAIPPNPLEF